MTTPDLWLPPSVQRNAEPPTTKQLRYIHALLRRLGIEHADRHAVVGTTLGRTIQSMNDLSIDEASTVIDYLSDEERAQFPEGGTGT